MRRSGFALPVALVIMVAVSIIATTALQVAITDLQANRANRLASLALFAAEAGADRTLARWSAGPFSSLQPGDSASTGWISLPDGSQYLSVVLRVDDGTGPTPLFRVRTMGSPGRGARARRQIIVMVQSGAASACCDAAVAMAGRLTLRAPKEPGHGKPEDWPPPQLDGRDHTPSEWAGYCPTPSAGAPGLIIGDEDDLRLQRDARVVGAPDLVERRGIGPDVTDRVGSVTYDDLAQGATIVFNGNRTTIRSDIGPSARRGECDTSDPLNWGAPTKPHSVCWDYLPVIHSEGSLSIQSDGEGQGVLLVDGDLDISGAFDFYGIVVVKGRIVFRGTGTLTGALIVGNGANGRNHSQVREGYVVHYSSCATARVSSDVGGARFLPGRHWFEVP